MKIVADDQIPLLDELFPHAVLIKKPGTEIRQADLLDADMLWVRTVTQVDAQLLAGTAVRFVGTATAGYDHLDVQWLDSQGIAWAYAPGANAVAVVEYVLCVIAALRTKGILCARQVRVGVIGIGRVGSIVANVLRQIGMQVVVNDPPRAAADADFYSTPLSEFKDLDLICLHPALVKGGDYPSLHLLNDDFLARQRPGTVLLNASRGAVLDTAILLRQPHLRLCLDVWEGEPEINVTLLQRAEIATPHIAAYSIAAKLRASLLLYQQAQPLFPNALPESPLPPGGGGLEPAPYWIRGWGELNTPVLTFPLGGGRNNMGWEKQALAVFNPLELTVVMQQWLLTNTGNRFLQLRKEYKWRESFLSACGLKEY
jgi:erythronate-4-phosphate dehydrogenase